MNSNRNASGSAAEIAMRIKSFMLACFALAALAPTGSANAQSCAGFTDLLASSSFCPDAEWLKNRQITTGCTSATLYCPNNPVTRLAMAAFLHRLGVALTPFEMTPVSVAPAARNLSQAIIVCQTADFTVPSTQTPPGPYPRRAYVNGAVHLSLPTAGVDVVASLQFSTNSGNTWTPITASGAFASLYPGASPGNHVTLSPYGWQDIAVGQTMRFGLAIGRFDGTGNVTAGCNLTASIANRNPASSPL
jgi:hypothetical protein